MPLVRKRDHILDLLNRAVNQKAQLDFSRSEMLKKPLAFWLSKTGLDELNQNQSYISAQNQENADGDVELGSIQSQSQNYTDANQSNGILKFKILLVKISLYCETLCSTRLYTYLRACLLPLSLSIVCYECPQDNLGINNARDYAFAALDYIVCCVFIIDSILRLAGLYIHIAVEDEFKRKKSILSIVIRSGIIDIAISVTCISLGITVPGLWMRLFRTVVITKVLLDAFPHFDILLSCLLRGIQSIFYILIIFFSLVIMYGNIGYYFFSVNDPFHFGNVMLSCLEFFCLTTIENWSTVAYTNIHGCNGYTSEYQYIPPIGFNVSEPLQTDFGLFYLPNCDNPQSQPVVASVILISYVILNAYFARELCLAAVTTGVQARLDELKYFSIYGDEITDVRFLAPKILSTTQPEKIAYIERILGPIWEGNMKSSLPSEEERKRKMSWKYVSGLAKSLINHKSYSIALFSIILADCIVTLSESAYGYADAGLVPFHNEATDGLHLLFQILFLIDVVVNFASFFPKFTQGHLKEYISNGVAVFDVATLVVFFIPAVSPNNPKYFVLKYFRIIRMIRLILIGSRYSSPLAISVGAIHSSQWAVLFVLLIFLVVFLYYACAGILLFKRINPYYFSTISRTLFTLLQLLTLDNWSDLMRKSIFGCYYYGYSTGLHDFDSTCQSTEVGVGWWSPLYFVSFLVLNSMVLVSLIIGIIISSMVVLQETNDDLKDITDRLNVTLDRLGYDISVKDLLFELYEFLDKKLIANTTFDDLRPLVDTVNLPLEVLFELFLIVDLDKSGQVDFAEFCEYIYLVGNRLKEEDAVFFLSQLPHGDFHRSGLGAVKSLSTSSQGQSSEILSRSSSVSMVKVYPEDEGNKFMKSRQSEFIDGVDIKPDRQESQGRLKSDDYSSRRDKFGDQERQGSRDLPVLMESPNDDSYINTDR